MFGGFGNRAAAYAKVSVETGVNTADPHKLFPSIARICSTFDIDLAKVVSPSPRT